jgi:hypothetical protein
VTQKEQE